MILVLKLLFGIVADAVKCFQCKSGFDTGCGIPFRPEGLPTCTGRFCSLVDAKVQGAISVLLLTSLFKIYVSLW